MVDVWLSAASECSPPAMMAHFALHSEHGHGNRESMCIGKVLALSRACVILSLLDCQAFPPHSPTPPIWTEGEEVTSPSTDGKERSRGVQK